jgi:hypothetical protein
MKKTLPALWSLPLLFSRLGLFKRATSAEFNDEKITRGTNIIYKHATMLPSTKSQDESSAKSCGYVLRRQI